MPLYDTVADLSLHVDGYDLERAAVDVSTGFTRVTTTVALHGGGHEGRART